MGRWGRNGILIWIALSAGGESGCVSGLRPMPIQHELPPDLSKDMIDRFDLHDSDLTPAGSQIVDPIKREGPSGAESQSQQSHRKNRKRNETVEKSDRRVASVPHSHSKSIVYPARRSSMNPIWLGERLTYTISYLGLSAGELTLAVQSFKMMDHRKVYHVSGRMVNSPVFGVFYRMDDVAETFIDYEGNYSHRFHLVLNESKQTRDSLELYDAEKKQTFYWNRVHPKNNVPKEVKEFAPIESFPQDSLSSLYYVRTLPLPVGSVVTFPVVSEGKQWEAVCTVVRKETLDTPLGRVNTIVVKPEMRFQGVPSKRGDSFIWLTDDERRIPVRLEARVKIGTVVAHLRGAELGTPPPVESLPNQADLRK